jgi:ParB family transcriptional regulator, chromosome partitioning protein
MEAIATQPLQRKGRGVSNSLLQIPVDELMVDPNQPRRVLAQSEIDRLAASIAAHGILQPLRVMWDKERKLARSSRSGPRL